MMRGTIIALIVVTVLPATTMPLEDDMLEISFATLAEVEHRIGMYWARGCARMETWGRTWNGTPYRTVAESQECANNPAGDPYALAMYLERDLYAISSAAVFKAISRTGDYWAYGCAAMETWGRTWNGSSFRTEVAICY